MNLSPQKSYPSVLSIINKGKVSHKTRSKITKTNNIKCLLRWKYIENIYIYIEHSNRGVCWKKNKEYVIFKKYNKKNIRSVFLLYLCPSWKSSHDKRRATCLKLKFQNLHCSHFKSSYMASEHTNLKKNSKNNNPHSGNSLTTFIAILAVVALLFIALSVF